MTRALFGRVSALEGGQQYSTHEDWVDALEALERGEAVDWSAMRRSDPGQLRALIDGEQGR